MSPAVEITDTQLTNALRALDINFIMGGQSTNETLHKQPARLIAALAESNESRLRLSLIPLFLEHHEFALHVRTAVAKLDPSARLTLQCYYTAAVWLSQKYRQPRSLRDYFSRELELQPGDDPEDNLRALARRHKELSGTWVNWLGTYLHAATIWQRGLQYRGWTTPKVSLFCKVWGSVSRLDRNSFSSVEGRWHYWAAPPDN